MKATIIRGFANVGESLRFMRVVGLMVSAVAVVPSFATAAYAPASIVFDTPAADERGIMVLGNGEVGATRG